MKIIRAGIPYGLKVLKENHEGINTLSNQVGNMVSQLGGALDDGTYGRYLRKRLSGLFAGGEIIISNIDDITVITPMTYPAHNMFVMLKAEGSITDRMISNMARSIYHHSIQMTRGIIFNITWTGEIQCCFVWMNDGKIFTFKFS